jgi:hypothetical protein
LIILFQLAAEREADLKKQAEDKAAKNAKKKNAANNPLIAYRSGVGKYLNIPSTSGFVFRFEILENLTY